MAGKTRFALSQEVRADARIGAARPLINGQVKIAIAARSGSEVVQILSLAGIDKTIPVLPTAELALWSALEIE
jgi:hypothetical protein